MGLNNIYALWLLPSLGLIILMYLLKEEHEEMEISSLYLWKTVMAESEVKKPWQKLKNNILMLLQLLAAFLIIMALANPFIKSGRAIGGNIVLAIDNSASMNTYKDGKSRLESAKTMAEGVVRQAPKGSYFTVVSVARDANIEISNTADKTEAINKIKAIASSNMVGNLDNQKSIIKAIYNQYQNARLIAYTDEAFNLAGMKGQLINLGSNGENVAIANISYSDEDDAYTVMIRLENISDNDVNREIALYADGDLLALKELEILAQDSLNVYFYGIRKDYEVLRAELTEDDALMEDNKAFLVLENRKAKKVLMISKGNIFIEKALNSIEGLELYKTDNFDIKDGDYDLYIFDGKSPKELPSDGALLFVNPDGDDDIFQIQGYKDNISAHFNIHPINKHIGDYQFYINKSKIIKKPIWAESLIVSGDDVLAAAGKFEGKDTGYISFDIRESDLPLSPEFPIFIYNIISYLTGLETKGKNFYQSGETIDLTLPPDIEKATIVTPSGKEENINENILDFGFNDTNELGVYKVNFRKGEESSQVLFAVNFPIEESRNAFSSWSQTMGENEDARMGKAGFDLARIFIIIVLLVILIEWAVYNRGN